MTTTINITTPAGTYGFAVHVWGDTYAVAANWAEASAPVYTWCEDGWTQDSHGRQVADFRHRPKDALRSHLREVSEEGGDEISDTHLDKIVARCVPVSDGE